MNHKRGKPKSARAGCMLCKPHKHQAAPLDQRDPPAARRALQEPVERRGEWAQAADNMPPDSWRAIACEVEEEAEFATGEDIEAAIEFKLWDAGVYAEDDA